MNVVAATFMGKPSGKLVSDRLDQDRDTVPAAERRHLFELLSTIDREAHVSQRKLATQLGVALGLVNAYMKRCVRKGLIKVQQAPARRYAYYLTPKGFAEKSVLTAEYLTSTLSYFRQARTECGQAIADAKRRGWKKVGISGCGELAEITVLCASEQGIEIAALLAPGAAKTRLLGIDVVATLDDVAAPPDGWVVTEIEGAQKSYDVLASRVGSDFVLVLPMLPVRRTKRSAVTVAGRLTPLTDGQRAVRQRSDQGVE